VSSKRFPFLLLLLILFACEAFSQKWDTTYWEYYPEKLSVSFIQALRGYQLSLNHKPEKNIPRENLAAYRTYAPITSGLRINWELVGLTLSVRTPFIQNSGTSKSDYFQFGGEIGSNTHLGEIILRKFSGFHESDKLQFFPPGQVFNDVSLDTRLLRFKYMYNVNHDRYAIRSGYSAKYRQIRSCGTPLIQFNAWSNSFKSDSSLFPIQLVDSTAPPEAVNHLQVNGFSLGGGYAQTFVIKKKYFFSLMAVPCIEGQWRKYSTATEPGSFAFHVAGSLSSKIQAGYNSRRVFSALVLSYELNTINKEKLLFQSNYYTVEFSVGYRFGLPEVKMMRWFR
jgi:hypothetical protein